MFEEDFIKDKGNNKKYHYFCDSCKKDSWFNYHSTEDEDFKKSWALENLQLLWKTLNRSKSDRFAGGY